VLFKNHFIVFVLPIILASTIYSTSNSEIFAQTGSLASLQSIDPTYAVSIVPGAAQKENVYYY
jgi:hypothetical protein